MRQGALDVLAVAAGGAFGAGARYLLGRTVQSATRLSFPLGTLCVNVLGCLLFGLLFVVLADRGVHARWQLFLCTGLLGGFTTFSAFSHETMSLIRSHQFGSAAANAGLSLALCLAATFLGAWCGALLRPTD